MKTITSGIWILRKTQALLPTAELVLSLSFTYTDPDTSSEVSCTSLTLGTDTIVFTGEASYTAYSESTRLIEEISVLTDLEVSDKDYDTFTDCFVRKDECIPYVLFTFETEGAGQLSISTNAVNNLTGTLEYSLDNVTWTTWDYTTLTGLTTLYLRGTGNTRIAVNTSTSYAGTVFNITSTCSISGNINSLLDYGDVNDGDTRILSSSYSFKCLFYNKVTIRSIYGLIIPATVLSDHCYYSMFNGCTSLIDAPSLPATTLANYCYYYMFNGCTSLIDAPSLPATTLADSCYYSMFSDCTSLIDAPSLPATTLANYCYYSMFNGCTSLIDAPSLPATTLASNCYSDMFNRCTSLLQAPELPATVAYANCYQRMFYGCTSLSQPPELPATALSNYCYSQMFEGCTSLTSPPLLPATTLVAYCYQNMFNGCKNLVAAPDLPATVLANYCYQYMFYGCTSLTSIPDLPATTLANYCYQYMFYGCTSLTSIPDLPATTLASYCYYYMFSGCTSIKLSRNRTGSYTKSYRIPSTGTGTTVYGALVSMFTGTGGSFKSTPTINTTYYISQDYSVYINGYTLQPLRVGDKEYTIDKIIVKDGDTELIYPVK